jgi:class 3 adenylate cyclase
MSAPTESDAQDAPARDAAARAERYLGQGEPLLAYNAVQEGLEQAPGDPRLSQLLGLSLARAGDPAQANLILSRLAQAGHRDAETLGVLARTHKDLAERAVTAIDARRHLDAAFRLYREAFDSARDRGDAAGAAYAGINTAAVAVLRGDLDTAKVAAATVRQVSMQTPDEPWRDATLGEAALILGESVAAQASYRRAVSRLAGQPGHLASTRRQARRLALLLPGDIDWIDAVLGVPAVAMYTGHMIDLPDRPVPRFPASLESWVRDAAHEQVRRLRPVASYGSAACGVDLIYLEALRDAGVETHVVLPFSLAEFRQTSVEGVPGDWGARFDRAMAAAASVSVVSEHRARGSDAPYEYANLMLTGRARLRAQALDTDVVGLAIWDGQETGGAGGAASLVRIWREQRFTVDERRLPEPIPVANLRSAAAAGVAPQVPSGFTHEIRTMLFADAVGYSRLNEDQIPEFVRHFLGAVQRLREAARPQPEHVESAGDGLYMVFADARAAGHFALALSRLVSSTDWTAYGLPPSLNLRIALHCGPVYCGSNPLTGARLYTGPHTSRAARIEPVTPPGQVYASDAFAAMVLAQGVRDLDMTYMGRVPLAKAYGTLPLYHVRDARGDAVTSVGAVPA